MYQMCIQWIQRVGVDVMNLSVAYRINQTMKWYDHTIGDYYLDKNFSGKNLNRLWNEELIVFHSITDMSHLILDNADHMRVMYRLGIANNSSSYDFKHYQLLHYAYQVLFTNTDVFMETINGWRPQFRKHRIGVQFRTGGKLANTHESSGYLNLDDVPLCVKTVNDYCRKHNYTLDSVTIHVATDSNDVLMALQQAFPTCIFVPPFRSVAHTSFVTSRKRFESYYSALVDIALLRECEYLMLTSYSSFGWASGMQMKEWNGVYLAHGKNHVVQTLNLILK